MPRPGGKPAGRVICLFVAVRRGPARRVRPPVPASLVVVLRSLELLMGFEPMTSSLPRTCSTPEPQQREFGLVSASLCGSLPMERVMGIEPTQPAWKAGALPLSYTRMSALHPNVVVRFPLRSRLGSSSPRSVSFSRSSGPAVSLCSRVLRMVGEVGFEPTKAKLTGLQPVPFNHSGIPPLCHSASCGRPTPSWAGPVDPLGHRSARTMFGRFLHTRRATAPAHSASTRLPVRPIVTAKLVIAA